MLTHLTDIFSWWKKKLSWDSRDSDALLGKHKGFQPPGAAACLQGGPLCKYYVSSNVDKIQGMKEEHPKDFHHVDILNTWTKPVEKKKYLEQKVK